MNPPSAGSAAATGDFAAADPVKRDAALDYLRSFLIVLVVFLHAALPYTGFAYFHYAHYIQSTAPVVDGARWPLLDPLAQTVDTFLMFLLFLISGVFAAASLRRRGSGGYIRERARRLGIPFLIGILALMPLAFWTSYLQAGIGPAFAFWGRAFTVDGWQTGPVWFLWMLLAFDIIVALCYRYLPGFLGRLDRRPSLMVFFLIAIAAFLIPFMVVSPYWWLSLSFIDMMPARVPFYFAFFVMGIAFGSDREWWTSGQRHWGRCLSIGLLFAVLFIVLQADQPDVLHKAAIGVAFACTSAGMSLGLMGAFRALVRRRHRVWDNLSANSFGIFLFHYPVVSWVQFLLLPAAAPGWLKFLLAFGGGLGFSWVLTAVLRCIPAVGRLRIL
jgi:fucose 4-O-acetylase-like acetyltransferase